MLAHFKLSRYGTAPGLRQCNTKRSRVSSSAVTELPPAFVSEAEFVLVVAVRVSAGLAPEVDGLRDGDGDTLRIGVGPGL